MHRLTKFNKNTHKALRWMKSASSFLLTLLLSTSLLLSACSKPSIPAVQTTEQVKEQTSVPASDNITKKAILGVIKINGGDLLERDIIPQLCKVFSLSEQKVKEALAAANSNILINTKLTDFRRMEGMILPGEYEITEGSTLEGQVSYWISESEKRYNKLLSTNNSLNNLKPAEQLSLAAMVEAECLISPHQEEVATVFLNRLKDGSKLQSCVTAEYALGYQRPYLTSEDVAKVSDYNTYYVSGLPIGPICAVSDASLQAAMHKKMDSNIYYFYYDYILNDIFFYSDYTKFRKEGAISRKNFEEKASIDKREKINKQLFCHF
jgi:cell division protein YceG involved in septum cleavage